MIHDIEDLKKSYRALPWYARLFFPSTLSASLTASPFCVRAFYPCCETFLDNKWSLQRWVFSLFSPCLDVFSQSLLMRSLKVLSSNNLLITNKQRPANFSAVLEHKDSDAVARVLLEFPRNMAQANFDAMMAHCGAACFC